MSARLQRMRTEVSTCSVVCSSVVFVFYPRVEFFETTVIVLLLSAVEIMISLEQWRAVIGINASFKSTRRGVIVTNGCDDYLRLQCGTCVIICASLIGMLLILSGNVELNPGPCKKCPICDNNVPNRSFYRCQATNGQLVCGCVWPTSHS